MEVTSAINAGLQGIQQSQQKIDKVAADIAGVNTLDSGSGLKPEVNAGLNNVGQPRSSVNVAEQLVELRQQELTYKASVEVVRNADQLLSKFVDEMV